MEKHELTVEELQGTIENQYEDERLQRNDWECRYNLNILEELLPQSHERIRNTLYLYLQDGLHAVEFTTEETPCMQSDIDLFEIEAIVPVTKEDVGKAIQEREIELIRLQFLLTL